MLTDEKTKQLMKSVNDKFIKDSILNYGYKLKEIKINSIVNDEFTITIAYGIIDKNYRTEKTESVVRVTVYNYNTLSRIYLDGNVYDTNYAENLTFEKVLNDCKNNLTYQLNKINKTI
jgi:hypothetical protein